jgi:hypothetical protein
MKKLSERSDHIKKSIKAPICRFTAFEVKSILFLLSASAVILLFLSGCSPPGEPGGRRVDPGFKEYVSKKNNFSFIYPGSFSVQSISSNYAVFRSTALKINFRIFVGDAARHSSDMFEKKNIPFGKFSKKFISAIASFRNPKMSSTLIDVLEERPFKSYRHIDGLELYFDTLIETYLDEGVSKMVNKKKGPFFALDISERTTRVLVVEPMLRRSFTPADREVIRAIIDSLDFIRIGEK